MTALLYIAPEALFDQELETLGNSGSPAFCKGLIGSLSRIGVTGHFRMILLEADALSVDCGRTVYRNLLDILAHEGLHFELAATFQAAEAVPVAGAFFIGKTEKSKVLAARLGACFYSVSTPGEAEVPGGYSSWTALADALKLPPRISKVVRETKETKVTVQVNLDGTGKSKISTGIGFFDHMLDQIAVHARLDLEVSCVGDLNVDEHHSIEDTGLAFGKALLEALGNKAGLQRYGFVLPMDESSAQVTLDFSGRSLLKWNVLFQRESVGNLPTEMVPHFFRSVSDGAACTLHIQAEGTNEHHKIEAIFKSFGRALRQALRRDLNSNELPSSKGVL